MVIEPRNLSRLFDELIEAARVRRIRFHDLRHTCASRPRSAVLNTSLARSQADAIDRALGQGEWAALLLPSALGPVEGPTEPKLVAVEPRHPRAFADTIGGWR